MVPLFEALLPYCYCDYLLPQMDEEAVKKLEERTSRIRKMRKERAKQQEAVSTVYHIAIIHCFIQNSEKLIYLLFF